MTEPDPETAPEQVETLGASLDETTIEEIVPAAARKPRHERGDRPLLDVRGLHTSFHTRDGVVRAVDGIDFHVDRGEIMGLVGESGCGKSVTSLSILRLVANPGRIDAGQVIFDGTDLLLGVVTGSIRTEHEVVLHPGDTVLFYSDGLIERRGQDLDDGIEELVSTARELAGLELGPMCDRLLAELVEADQEDDVCLIGLRVRP